MPSPKKPTTYFFHPLGERAPLYAFFSSCVLAAVVGGFEQCSPRLASKKMYLLQQSVLLIDACCLRHGDAPPYATTSETPRHLLKNTSRLLQLQTRHGIESLALAGCRDNESFDSSSESDTTMPDVQADFRFGSSGSQRLVGSYTRCETKDKLARAPPPVDTRMMASRMRRLDAGRKRAEAKRRTQSRLRVAKSSKEHRELHLTCDAGTLASAASSFGVLTHGEAGVSAGGGLAQKHILAVRDRFVRDLSGLGKQRKGSAKVIVGALKGRFFSTRKPSPSAQSKEGDIGGSSPLLPDQPVGSGVGSAEGRETRTGGESVESCLPGRATDSLSEQKMENPPPQPEKIKGVTLDELLEAVDRLAKQAVEGPMGLAAFTSWWVGAMSKAELELKQRFMEFSSKKKG